MSRTKGIPILLIAGGLILAGIWMVRQAFPVRPPLPPTPSTAASIPPIVVEIVSDGEITRLETVERLPKNLAALAGIPVYPGDQILEDGTPLTSDLPLAGRGPFRLEIVRAVPLTVMDGELTQEFFTRAPTLGQALFENGIELRSGDRLSLPGETPLLGRLSVVVKRAVPIMIHLAEESYQFRTAAATVGEALAEAGLSLQALDYSIPPQRNPLPEDGNIQVIRIRERVEIEQEPLAFPSLTQPAADLEIDQTQILQVGEFGLTARRVRVRYENGEVVSRTVGAEWIASEPKPRIVGYGTNIVVRTLDTPTGAIEYWRAVPAYATSYSPCRLGTETCSDRTASGMLLEYGVVGLIRAWYNVMVGSSVYVPGYGTAIVADIGGGVPGQHWIDLGYSDDDWISWSQNVTIYFLTPVPPADQILWILP